MSAIPQVVTIVVEGNDSSVETRYVSTHGYITNDSDSPSSQVFLPRLRDSVEYSIEVGCQIWGNSGSKISFGTIDIDNTDGELDSWLSEQWRDRTITIRRGLVNQSFSAHDLVAIAIIDKISAPDFYTIRLTLRDKSALLDIPLQRNLYPSLLLAPSLEGTPRPICIGDCFNIPGVLVDSAMLDYDVHDDEFFSIEAVKDQGVYLSPSDEWDISIDSNVNGFRFNEGNNPAGKITADVRGAMVGTSLIERLPDVIDYVINKSGGAVTTSEIDSYTVENLDFSSGYTICYYGRDSTTISNVLTQILDSYSGWWYFDRFGMLKVGRLEEPSTAVRLEINDINIVGDISIKFDEASNLSSKIGYGRNWSPHGDSDIAGSLMTETSLRNLAESLKNQYKIISATVTSYGQSYGFAIDAEPIKTLLSTGIPAQLEIDRIRDLYSSDKYFYTVPVAIEGSLAYELEPGDSVLLRTDRFGLSAGKQLLVVGVKTRLLSSVVELTLHGSGP